MNIFYVVVASQILPVLGCLVVYFLIYLDISSIFVTTFCGIFIDEVFVPGPVSVLLFTGNEVVPDVGNGSLDISSNI